VSSSRRNSAERVEQRKPRGGNRYRVVNAE